MLRVTFPCIVAGLLHRLLPIRLRLSIFRILSDIVIMLLTTVVSIVLWGGQHRLDGRERRDQFVNEIEYAADEGRFVQVNNLEQTLDEGLDALDANVGLQ